MKYAYVSVVLFGATDEIDAREVERIDTLLDAATSLHEIIVVCRSAAGPLWPESGDAAVCLTGPLTVVHAPDGAPAEESALRALARAVGDFVLEWDSNTSALTADRLDELFAEVDAGREIVEVPAAGAPLTGRAFLRLANLMRPGGAPLRSVAARLSSRRAIAEVLSEAARVVAPHRLVLFADVRAARSLVGEPLRQQARPPFSERLGEAVDVLLLGTRAGTRLPSVLAGLFALVGLSATIYAVVVPIVRGRAPEGWTTLLGFSGVAASGVFLVLALLSAQLRLSMRRSGGGVGGSVDVYAPWRSSGEDEASPHPL